MFGIGDRSQESGNGQDENDCGVQYSIDFILEILYNVHCSRYFFSSKVGRRCQAILVKCVKHVSLAFSSLPHVTVTLDINANYFFDSDY